MLPQQVALQHRPTQELSYDVALLVVAWFDALVDAERDSSSVVGDSSQWPPVVSIEGIVGAHHFAGGLAQGAKAVDFKIAADPLHHRSHPLQAHAGINVLGGQRSEVVGRIANPVELGEDQIPDLHRLALTGVIKDLAARPADSVGSVGR